MKLSRFIRRCLLCAVVLFGTGGPHIAGDSLSWSAAVAAPAPQPRTTRIGRPDSRLPRKRANVRRMQSAAVLNAKSFRNVSKQQNRLAGRELARGQRDLRAADLRANQAQAAVDRNPTGRNQATRNESVMDFVATQARVTRLAVVHQSTVTTLQTSKIRLTELKRLSPRRYRNRLDMNAMNDLRNRRELAESRAAARASVAIPAPPPGEPPPLPRGRPPASAVTLAVPGQPPEGRRKKYRARRPIGG